jgi:RNA polymerase sigma factor (sigma-70 family)
MIDLQQNNYIFKKIKIFLPFIRLPYSMEELLTINPSMASTPGKNIASVISRFGQRLLGFIRQRVGNEADAEDILQDVWYQLTTTVDTEPIEQISGWLYAVARNKITDRYRKRRPESLDSLLPAGEEGGPDLGAILLDNSNNPETANLRALFWKTLEEALNELPEEQRSVFVWNELNDIPFKEIAVMTGENVNTLISRKRYAVLYLRERLLTLYHEITEH